MRWAGLALVAAAVLFGCETTGPGGGSGSGGSGGPPPADGGTGGGSPDAGPAPARHALSLRVTGSGDVRSASFDCRSDCQQLLDDGQGVHLEAVPDAGWKFDGWQGDCAGTGACDLTMSADRSVSAGFSAVPPPPPGSARVTVMYTGSGSGRVTSAPGGIDCPAACSMTVQAGTPVTLTAQPDASSTFIGWGGACSGASCVFTAGGDSTAWANFIANPPPPPPPPPPGPPAQCANITPGAPPAAMSITNFTQATCGAGMGDTTGTLGLQSFGSPGGDDLHFVNADTGAQTGVSVHNNTTGSFVPTRDGFIGVLHYLSNPQPYWFTEYWRHDAVFVQGGQGMVGSLVYAGTPFGTVAVAGNFNWYGLPPRPQLFLFGWNSTGLSCAHDLASAGTVFGLGGDAAGNVLVITDGGGGDIAAQWFDQRCTAMTGSFTLIHAFSAGPNTWFETAPLIGGGVAVRRVDQQNDPSGRPYRTSQWLVTLSAGNAAPQPAPKWLTDRPGTSMALARGATAYALLPLGAPDVDCAQKIDLLAADGTYCGSFQAPIAAGQCRTEDLGLSLEGTPVQLMPRNLTAPNTCAYRWWPHALR